MKKILYSAAAIALAFFAASCQQENLEPVKGNTVTYTVEAPGALQTKAIADGMNVNELVYEVWITSANGTTDLDGAQKLYQATTQMFQEDGKNKAKVTLDLVNDQHYTVLFWAQVAEADAYNTDDLTAVTYAKGAAEYLSNDESLAAFYAVDFVNDGVATNPTVLLKRPFAQVNLCTLNSKAAQVAGDYNIALVNSKMTLESVPTTFNVATKDVDDYVTMEFAYNAVPSGVDKTIMVNGEEYYYAGMNYVFAGANLTLTYDIQTSLNGSTNYATVNNTISDVPVKENHRTNIVGNLLTSKTDYEIIVDAEFDGAYYGPDFVEVPAYNEETKTWTITNSYELLYVAQQVNSGANSFKGQTVQVVNDIDLQNMTWTPVGPTIPLAFNGMLEGASITRSTDCPTIKNFVIENGNCSGFFGVLCNGGKVRNLKFADVTITGERQLGVVAGQVYGNLVEPTIENVTVENANIIAVPAFDGTEYDNGDKVGGIAGLIGQNAYIKNCTVKNSTFTGYRDMGGIVGCTQNGHACNLSGNNSENINFVVTSQYVPYNGNTSHGATGAIRGGTRSNASDVIEGNTSAEVSEVVLVNDVVSLQNAINAAAAGETAIKFISDITGNVLVVQKSAVKINIDGGSKKYNGSIKVHSNSNYYADAALTIKNVNFETSAASINVIEALENGSERYSNNITVENCSFTATDEAVNTSVAVQVKATRGVTVTGCTATDMHSLIQAQSCDTGDVKVVNCTVNGKNGVAFKQVKSATVEGTTITALAYGIRFDGNTDNYGVVVKDNNVTAVQPFIVRKMTGANNTIALEGANTLTTESKYQIVITNGSDDAEYVEPTGTYTLTGADSYKLFPERPVAMVGNTVYTSIDEAIANWTNGTTLTLVANVTLSDVITLKSTEYHILDLGTYTMTAAKTKDAISISNEGRSSASYALDIKADATNPGGITATSKAVVKTTGKSGVKDRPIIRFYNGVFNASNVISHSGSNGTNCPQFQFHGGVYNAGLSANRALIQIYGGTFNGRFYISVDSSAYALISGGKFKYLDYLYGSALNSDKFTIGSSKGNFDRGLYVDDEGYIVVGGAVITEFGDTFAAKATNASKAGSYLPYSSAAEHGLYYTNAALAIQKHGEANVVLK